jgi:transposase
VNGLPESYFSPPPIAPLRKKVRRRAFLVKRKAELKVKIQSVLIYKGVKPPVGYGLFTRREVEWLGGLGLELVDCYLKLMPSLEEEIDRLSREFQLMARGDEDVRPLMTVPGVGYYTAHLVSAEAAEEAFKPILHHGDVFYVLDGDVRYEFRMGEASA